MNDELFKRVFNFIIDKSVVIEGINLHCTNMGNISMEGVYIISKYKKRKKWTQLYKLLYKLKEYGITHYTFRTVTKLHDSIELIYNINNVVNNMTKAMINSLILLLYDIMSHNHNASMTLYKFVLFNNPYLEDELYNTMCHRRQLAVLYEEVRNEFNNHIDRDIIQKSVKVWICENFIAPAKYIREVKYVPIDFFEPESNNKGDKKPQNDYFTEDEINQLLSVIDFNLFVDGFAGIIKNEIIEDNDSAEQFLGVIEEMKEGLDIDHAVYSRFRISEEQLHREAEALERVSLIHSKMEGESLDSYHNRLRMISIIASSDLDWADDYEEDYE
jgi:hypothetical protein